MKFISTFLFLVFCSFYSFSQNTKFNLFIGGEATSLEATEPEFGDTVLEFREGFQETSYFFGVELEQNVFRDFDLVLRTSIGKKYINDIWNNGNVPFFSVEIPHLYNAATIRKDIYKGLKVGGGVSYNYSKDIYEPKKTVNELTAVIESIWSIKKFNFSLSYVFGLQKEYFFEEAKASKSFQLTVGYRLFDIKWKKGDKEVNCPST